MSQTGELVFFTRQEIDESPALLKGALRLTGATDVVSASRSIGESREFEVFLRLACEGILEDLATEDLKIESIQSIPAYYQEGSCLTIDVGDCPLCERMDDAIRHAVSKEILNDFYINGIFIRIGFHDIYESSEHPSGILIARPFFSFIFWGYGSPCDWDKARQDILSDHVVRQIRIELEEVTGSLEQCICWST